MEKTIGIKDALEMVTALDRVTGAKIWSRVPGKERIYIDTAKYNGGRHWNRGVGYATCYIDVNRQRLVCDYVAGAATRRALVDTIDALEEIASRVVLHDAA